MLNRIEKAKAFDKWETEQSIIAGDKRNKELEEAEKMGQLFPVGQEPFRKRRGRPPKAIKEANIMKGRSDIKKNENGKFSVDTEINVKKGLAPKVKKALKKSVITELDKKISGSGVRKIELDYTSSESEDEKPKRGRPKKKV